MIRPSARALLDLDLGHVLDPGSWESWDAPPAHEGASQEYAAERVTAASKSGADEPGLTGAGTLRGRWIAALVGEPTQVAPVAAAQGPPEWE